MTLNRYYLSVEMVAHIVDLHRHYDDLMCFLLDLVIFLEESQ